MASVLQPHPLGSAQLAQGAYATARHQTVPEMGLQTFFLGLRHEVEGSSSSVSGCGSSNDSESPGQMVHASGTVVSAVGPWGQLLSGMIPASARQEHRADGVQACSSTCSANLFGSQLPPCAVGTLVGWVMLF